MLVANAYLRALTGNLDTTPQGWPADPARDRRRSEIQLWAEFENAHAQLVLKDIDAAMIMPMLNRSLAEKLMAIHIYANGYKLMDIQRNDFSIDQKQFDPEIPIEFSPEELRDPWARIRPATGSSNFSLAFYDQTPKKMFTPDETVDRLRKAAL